jgi:hypothetical protein
MTLRNAGSTAAEVSGFSAVFYDGSGAETTSDTQTFDNPTFLEPGQSLSWDEESWGTFTFGSESVGMPFTVAMSGAMDPGTCQLVQWTHP